METLLKQLSEKINLELNEEEINQLLKFKTLLLEKNKVMNLTAIIDEKEVIVKHFIDSLTIHQYITPNSKLIDVGTGAGFPGVPIKIIKKDTEITLLDSLNKRINFLNEVIENLGLKEIQAVHSRAEELAHNKEYREKYDFVTARAVANLSTLAELCLPFLKVGGTFICMKGNSIEEIETAQKALETLGGQIEKIDHFLLPDSTIERNIILIKKEKHTPSQYPRKPGTPSKNPI